MNVPNSFLLITHSLSMIVPYSSVLITNNCHSSFCFCFVGMGELSSPWGGNAWYVCTYKHIYWLAKHPWRQKTVVVEWLCYLHRIVPLQFLQHDVSWMGEQWSKQWLPFEEGVTTIIRLTFLPSREWQRLFISTLCCCCQVGCYCTFRPNSKQSHISASPDSFVAIMLKRQRSAL